MKATHVNSKKRGERDWLRGGSAWRCYGWGYGWEFWIFPFFWIWARRLRSLNGAVLAN